MINPLPAVNSLFQMHLRPENYSSEALVCRRKTHVVICGYRIIQALLSSNIDSPNGSYHLTWYIQLSRFNG